MLSQPSLELLTTLIARCISELDQAVSQAQWQRVQQLDQQMKQSLLAIDFAALGDDPESKAVVVAELQRLMSSYQQTIAACQQHKAGLRHEILGLNKGRKVAKAYQLG